MIPLRDELPSRSRPVVTIALISANVLVFVYQFLLGPQLNQQLVLSFGAVPAIIMGSVRADVPVPAPLTILTSMFLHGGLLHVGGNMLFLWIFGDNVEDVMGRWRFSVFYLLCGFAAAFGQIVMNPMSKIPMIGASGAVSGILGAYFILFPRARIVTMIFFGFLVRLVRIPALFFLAFWFLLQFFYGTMSVGAQGGGGVAWFAHIGGFAAGCALVFQFRRKEALRWYRRFLS